MRSRLSWVLFRNLMELLRAFWGFQDCDGNGYSADDRGRVAILCFTLLVPSPDTGRVDGSLAGKMWDAMGVQCFRVGYLGTAHLLDEKLEGGR